MRPLRPLSSVTHALDHAAWPDAVWLMHIENLLLYALLCWAVTKLVTRVHGPGLVAGIAGLVFAVDESHALTRMWISGRNTLLAALFGVLTIHAHPRWRDPGEPHRRRYGVLAALGFGLALAAGEAGLCCFGYLLAWTLVRERQAARGWAALLPYIAVVVGWQLVYVLGEFGVHGSGLYLDLGHAPATHLPTFVGRALAYPGSLALAQLTLPVTDLLVIAPLAWIGLTAGFLALVWALRPLFGDDPTRHPAAFWLLGMLFAAVPLAATIPTARPLLLVGTGGSALVGLSVCAWRSGALLGRARRLLVGLVLVGNLVVAPLLFVPYGLSTALLERPHLALAEQVPSVEPGAVVVVLNLPAEINGLYAQAVRERDGGHWPDHVYTLYAGRDPLEVTRVDATTLALRCEAGWAAAKIDQLARDWTRGFTVGDEVSLAHARVEIVEVGDDGHPRAIRVHFDRDLDGVVLLGFDPALAPRELAVGESITLRGGVGQA